MIEKLAINVNGCDKYATGLNKSTTIDDLKYAMLTVSSSKCSEHTTVDDYGVFEKWQGNERLLDGRVKIGKLIRMWQALPGDQLSQVQFVIKQRRTTTRQQHVETAEQLSATPKAPRFALCTLSPSVQKTWNYGKVERQQKSSYVRQQLRKVSTATTCEQQQQQQSNYSTDDSATTSEEDVDRRRYASIRRYHR